MSKWAQIAEITVEPLRYVALKTDSGTFRMQVFNGDSLKSDILYRGKYAHQAANDSLMAFPVRFRWEPRNTDGISGGYDLNHSASNYDYGFVKRLSPKRQAQVETITGIDKVIRGFVGKSAVEQEAVNGLTNICIDLRELWNINH